MIKALLILLLLPTVAMGQGYFDGYTEGYGGVPETPAAVPDTFTWVWVNAWDDGIVNDDHESPYVPLLADIDSLIVAADGTEFMYGSLDQASPTVSYYSTTVIRQTLMVRENQYPGSDMDQPYFYWSLESLPENAEIISATLSYKASIAVDPLGATAAIVAVIDTSSTNYTNVAAGATRTVPDNLYYNQAAWDYADASTTTPWSYDMDTVFNTDYGWSKIGYSSVVLPPNSATSATVWSIDLTETSRKYQAADLSEKLIWLFGEGHASSLWRGRGGPYAGTKEQPVLEIVWTTSTDIDGVDFAVFSDNHSNRYAIELMGDAMDGVGFDPAFLLHNGDMNEDDFFADIDTTIAHQDSLAIHWKAIPIALTTGNHESAVACAQYYLESVVPTANRAFVEALPGINGSITKFGAFENPDMRMRNFSYDIGGVHFVHMDSEPRYATGDTITTLDIKWLESDLGSSAAAVKLVFFHRAFTDYAGGTDPDASPNWEALQSAMENGGVTAVFSGHTHSAGQIIINGIKYFNTPSTANLPLESDQGFYTVSVGASGAGTVKLYRGKNADHAYTFTESFSF